MIEEGMRAIRRGKDRMRVRSLKLAGRPVGRRRAWLSLLCAVVLVALLGAGWLWFRDSSLVAVERVTVSGETGSDAVQIRSALTAAARNMTTLDVAIGRLRAAVAAYPDVRDLEVSTQFPHGMRIKVIERVPIGEVIVARRRIAVASDGTLMYDLPIGSGLPIIPLRAPPVGERLTDRRAREVVALLAAAPPALRGRVSEVTMNASDGLVAQIRDGPSIYFGAASGLEAKWISAEAVLADPGSAGAGYIDVTDPRRPAAGAGSGQGTAAANP